MYKNLLITLILIISSSCDKKVYNAATCNKLSQAAFKGQPKAAHELKNSCKGVKIRYTKKTCADALNNLILGASMEKIKKAFGEQVVDCFTEHDLKKFTRGSPDELGVDHKKK